MSVIYLDSCHHCDRLIAAGIFCQLCLTVPMATSAPPEPRQAPRLADALAPALPAGASVGVAISAVTASVRNEQHPPTLSLASRVDGCL